MPCGAAIVQHARDGSSGSARRASTDERCARIPRMGRCAPPQDRVLLSPAYDAGTPRGGSRPARRAGATPCCVGGEKRKARGRAARCAMGGSTTRFRAVFWVLPHPCFPAYSFYREPKSCPERALSYTEMGPILRYALRPSPAQTPRPIATQAPQRTRLWPSVEKSPASAVSCYDGFPGRRRRA